MKFATLRHGARLLTAVVDPANEVFWPLKTLMPNLPAEAYEDLAAAIPHLHGENLSPLLCESVSLSRASLRAPIEKPPHNIMCVGKNYRAHAKEFSQSGFDAGSAPGDSVPDAPIIFSKPSSTINGPYDDIPLTPGLDSAVDYECELAVVIGKGGRSIRREQALEHIFGYTVVNDVTARDLQKRHKQWFLGKGADGFCPMGPWVVTPDEVQLDDMRLTCRVNADVRQDARISDLIFDIPILIETISAVMTLSAGDVIATGTPEGVGIGFDPPRFLFDGDTVECEITGIGTIRNTVRRVS